MPNNQQAKKRTRKPSVGGAPRGDAATRKPAGDSVSTRGDAAGRGGAPLLRGEYPFPKRPRVVITGAGSGLGRAFALLLAPSGARILAADLDRATAEETAAQVRALGGEGVAVRCDVGKLADVRKLAARAAKLWRGTDVLINNAGVGAGGRVGEVPMADWAWIMQVNLWGSIHGCHVFVPLFKKRRRGFILNVASTAGIASLPEMAAYNVTKAGVISLSETLASELAPYHVRVSVLCPTYFHTNLMQRFRSPDERQRHIANAFFGRASVTAETVAREGLAALQTGTLLVIPQQDGKQVFAAKTGDYEAYFRSLQAQVLGGVYDRLADEGAQRSSKSKELYR